MFGKPRSRSRERPSLRAHDDLVRGVLAAAKPNRLWLTDISEHPTSEGKIYPYAIRYVFSGRIVGHSIDSRKKSRLAVDALASVVQRRGGRQNVPGRTVHGDRGSPFGSWNLLGELALRGLNASINLVASAGDNAAVEPFFSLLKTNVLNRRRWDTRSPLRLAIITWIEQTYRRRRRQARLGQLTPIEYETITSPQAAFAA